MPKLKEALKLYKKLLRAHKEKKLIKKIITKIKPYFCGVLLVILNRSKKNIKLHIPKINKANTSDDFELILFL